MFRTVLYLFRLLSRRLHIAIKARLDIALCRNVITLVLYLNVFSVVLLNILLAPAIR